MASESLAKFSDLLRYQLYECNEPEIPLSQEIVYIENFIELEKLRQESNIQLNIDLQNQHAGNIYIAPFILMPFIENAFKHVSKKQDDDNWINLKLHYNEDEICMCVSNSVSEKYHSSNEPMRFTGIGLKNVKRRLHLLYTDKHEIKIDRTTDSFNVTLRITFNDAKTRMNNAPLMELTAT
jgi:LytS/YehU family sensor histidine kinase